MQEGGGRGERIKAKGGAGQRLMTGAANLLLLPQNRDTNH